MSWVRGDESQALGLYASAAQRLAGDERAVGVQVEWGAALRATGRVEESARVLEQARAELETRRGVEHPSSLPVLLGLVEVYAAQGRYAEAEALGVARWSWGSVRWGRPTPGSGRYGGCWATWSVRGVDCRKR